MSLFTNAYAKNAHDKILRFLEEILHIIKSASDIILVLYIYHRQ